VRQVCGLVYIYTHTLYIHTHTLTQKVCVCVCVCVYNVSGLSLSRRKESLLQVSGFRVSV
jgi:hypothetical protein